MKRFSEQFNKKASTVKLQAAEKRELRERLVSYMEYHPLPADLQTKKKAVRKIIPPQFTEEFTTVSVPFFSIFKSLTGFAVIILLTIPFMAERTVPGDALYAVKVQFNEELRSTLTFDGYQKVEWETERINRRIAEARLLASEGLLTEEFESEVAEAVKVHTESAKKEIAELKIEDADEAAIATIALDTTLEVQSASLRGDEDDEDMMEVDGESVDLIAAVIDESLEQAEAESDNAVLPSYDKMMARIEQNTTRVYELRNSLPESVSEVDLAEVTRRIEDIERSIQEAIELKEIDDTLSRLGLVDVLQRTQKLIVYMTELEVIETVDIETLVPVVLTTDEEVAKIFRLTDELTVLDLRITELSLLLEDEDILAKVSFAQGLIATATAQMASTTDNYEAFVSIAEGAIIIANDVLSMMQSLLEPTEIIVENEVSASAEGEVEEGEGAATTNEEVSDGETVLEDGVVTEEETIDLSEGHTEGDEDPAVLEEEGSIAEEEVAEPSEPDLSSEAVDNI